MKTRKYDTRWMVSVALMAAIVVLLANTPLGLIPLPIIKATTTHIPVIVGAEHAVDILKNGAVVTVDAETGAVSGSH